MATLLLWRLKGQHVGKKMPQTQLLQTVFLQHTVFLVFPHTTIPQPGPSKVTLLRTA